MTEVRKPDPGESVQERATYGEYCEVLEALQPNRIRITYDHGLLELMSTTPVHERVKGQLTRVLEALLMAFELDFLNGGSTTFKSELLDKGFEPDACYWLTHLDEVADIDTYDTQTSPPPDLGIEVDLTSSSIDRMAIYAAFGVSELWRYQQDGRLHVYRLHDQEYGEVERSRFLPQVPPRQLIAFIDKGKKMITSRLIREAQRWAHELMQED